MSSFGKIFEEHKTPIIAGVVCVVLVIGLYYYSYGEMPAPSNIFSGASGDCTVTIADNDLLRQENGKLQEDIEQLKGDITVKKEERVTKNNDLEADKTRLVDLEARLTDAQKKLKNTNKNVTIISSVFGGIAFVIFAVFFVIKLVRKYKKRQGVVSNETVPAPVAALTNAAANVATAAAEAVVETAVKSFTVPVSIITNQPNIGEIIQTEHLPSLSFDLQNNVKIFHPSR